MKSAQAKLEQIDLTLIDDHPDNPRLYDRQEVIDGIAASLRETGEFAQKHAVHVRPLAGKRFQLLAGHHRKKAAIKAGVKKVWAWIEDVDDREALMALVLANRQGELSPLEIGLHVLKAVPTEEGGRGKKGGLSAYAQQIGKSHQYVSQLRAAAEVADSVKHASQLAGLESRTQHLFEIHSATRNLWPALVQAFLALPDGEGEEEKQEWTVARTKEAVRSLNQSLKGIPDEWRRGYLRPADVASQIVQKKVKPQLFVNLVRLATYLDGLIRENKKALPDTALADYHGWLKDHARGLSWDMKGLQEYRATIEELIAGAIPEGLYDVILSDPPWQYDFAETARSRQVENQYPTMDVEAIKAEIIPASDNAVLFLWATAPKLVEAISVMDAWGFEYKTCAVWDKEILGMGYWFRGQHELLLVGVKGAFSPPEASARISSVIRARRGKHSQKPEEVYKAIDRMFPEARKWEWPLRGEPRPGWAGSGYEEKANADAERHTA